VSDSSKDGVKEDAYVVREVGIHDNDKVSGAEIQAVDIRSPIRDKNVG
jgi:hypothetical protein